MKVSAAAPLNSNTDPSGIPSLLLPTCWLRVCVVPLEHSRRRRVMEQLIKTPAMRADKAGHIAVCSTISPAIIVVMIDIFDEQCIKLEAREHTQCSRESRWWAIAVRAASLFALVWPPPTSGNSRHRAVLQLFNVFHFIYHKF